MQRKKEDRRIRLTKLAIRESLIELMQRLPISKISVKMLCEAADINRSTFYAHYKDQYELLHAVQRELLEDVKEKVFPTQFFKWSDGGRTVLTQLLEYGKQNAALLLVLLGEGGDGTFQTQLIQLAREKVMEEFEGATKLPEHTVTYVERFLLSGFLSVMRLWLETGCPEEPEELGGLMMELTVHGTKSLY